MDEAPTSRVEALSEFESWKASRSGAWAGRGFDYQYWVTVLVLLRQWAGQLPLGHLVPEGLDDCVVELADRRIWLQAKSRKSGGFPASEVLAILDATAAKAAKVQAGAPIRSAVILEQQAIGHSEADFESLFDDAAGRVFVCEAPDQEVLRLLLSRLKVATVIAEGVANELYALVVDASKRNASLPFDKRRKISATEVDRRIFERLEAEDPAAIDEALVSGVIEPVDFGTPVDEPDFYRGVKVKAGHVAANLVLDRPKDVHRTLETLMQRRHVLVSGPSGAGKSGLMWLAAAAAADRMRWYQITGIATATNAEAIIRFVRARRPTASSPLALVLDELGSTNNDLWDVLARELRGFSNLYLLGSVRQEDVNLIANQSECGFVSLELDDELAQGVWKRLATSNQTEWSHWREPFEQSEGLMLEYIHLLTQGRRLATVIRDQVRQRGREHRDDELGIIRSTAVLCARGGEVDADRLFELLGLNPDAGHRALGRLIDEHVVRESRPGVLGGLHQLRSDALVKASHDETVLRATDTLWKCLSTTTVDTLPRVVQSLLGNANLSTDATTLPKLAGVVAESGDVEFWTAILTGLGLATLDRHVTELMTVLDRHGLERAHWSLAASFTDPLLDIPDLSVSDQWTRLRDALTEFRKMPKHDLRAKCLVHLPAETAPLVASTIWQATALFSALAPISGGDPIKIAIDDDFLVSGEPDIRQIARLLSTAHLVDRDLAEQLVGRLGGQQALFDLFRRQTPWTTLPEIDLDGRHGRTVRSNWYHISDNNQSDPHATICEICEVLIAISPECDAAASDAVNASGEVIAIGDFCPWSKNIPRANLPAKPRVAWNVAFRRVFLARSAVDSLTDYAKKMAEHVRRTEKIFRSFSEKWIKGKRIPNADGVAAEINDVLQAVNALAYAEPETAPRTMMEPSSAGSSDTLGALLTGVLGNLVGRMPKIESAKATAAFAGNLQGQAREHCRSSIWRTTSSPPVAQLEKLAERLGHVSSILHEMARNGSGDAIGRTVAAAKKASMGHAVRAAALFSRGRGTEHFRRRVRKLERALSSRGWNVRCLARLLDELDCPYWPAREIAILVQVNDLADQWVPMLDGLLNVANKFLDNDWPFTAVPVMNGQVLTSLAVVPTSHIPLPDQEFARKWAGSLDRPTFVPALLETFEEAVAASVEISAIINARGIDSLHPDEDSVLSRALARFEDRLKEVETAANEAETEHFALALDYLNQTLSRLSDEVRTIESGQPVANPLCMTPYVAIAGQGGDDAIEIAALRLALVQAECDRMVFE